MPQYCCIRGCTNNRSSGAHLFKFPLSKEELLAQWMAAIKIADFRPTKYSVICSKHFTAADFLERPYKKGVRLKQCAVPSIFENVPLPLSKNDAASSNREAHCSKVHVHEAANEIPVPLENCLATNYESQEPSEMPIEPIAAHFTYETRKKKILSGTAEQNNNTARNKRDVHTADIETSDLFNDKKTKKPKIMSSSMIHIINQELTPRKQKMHRKRKTLQQKLMRKEKKIRSLKELLATMRKKNLLDGDACSIIEHNFSGSTAELFRNELKNKNKSRKGNWYSEEIKQLALTLHYYSPKAYEYCRTFLQLPHASSIRNWTSSVSAEPGFLKDVFAEISQFPLECRNCNLVFDSMSIRKQVLWDPSNSKFIGLCDYGNELRIEDSENPATEVLVFMLVALNGKFKWPIGYFFINKITTAVQAELVRTALILSSAAGIRVWGVTCDGAFINYKTMMVLGCDLCTDNYDDIKCFFKHPSSEERVYFVPDAAHNLKLARNALGDMKFLYSSHGIVAWRYIENLVELQKKLNLKLANKLSFAHVDWKKNVMKVKLAAQTLSSSTADALEFLQSSELKEYNECAATVEFIRAIDRVFDFLNTRNPFASGFKKPLFLNNLDYLEPIIVDKIKYLYNLQGPDKKPVHLSRRKTFIIGLATAVKSIFEIARQLLAANSPLKYLLTYRFSQDHLEIFFSQIRRRNSWNNNPNVSQFKSALKQILLKNSIKASEKANCTIFENSSFSAAAKFRWTRKISTETTDNVPLDTEVQTYVEHNLAQAHLRQNVLYYIAGFISRKLMNKLKCEGCIKSLICNRGDHNYSHSSTYSVLTNFKNRGGLINASESVFKVISKTESEFLIHTNCCQKIPDQRICRQIVNRIKNHSALQSEIFPTDDRCLESSDVCLEPPHRLKLIEVVADKYLTLRMHSFSQYITKEVLNPTSQRHKLSKLILFQNM